MRLFRRRPRNRVFDEIPLSQPQTPLLDRIESPADLRRLPLEDLPRLCDELRALTLYSVGQTGGHLGAGLGVIELTVALHYVFDTPKDNLVWDVGHQCYPHKILTGRRHRMASLRQQGGLKGFPSRDESEYDSFGTGHSSTSISAALGMALAAPHKRAVAVIGDGGMTAGMAYEALCHAAHQQADLLVVLNDNGMSISPNSGGLANYLGRLWSSRFYWALRDTGARTLAPIPVLKRLARQWEAAFKSFFVKPSGLFESLGFAYTGPLDGQDVLELIAALRNIDRQKGPRLLHLVTRKGAGLRVAEEDPVGYHAIAKIEKVADKPATKAKPRYQDLFGDWLCTTAAADPRLVGITPAMREGSGMVRFARDFPERYHDVAIAEQHALTFAAGLACEPDTKPVVAIYSTFLQRAYDQLIHDISIQRLDVTLAIDRAGLTGEDGATHAGAYDLSYLRAVPHLLLAAPSDADETRLLLDCCYRHPGPAAVRYPRGSVCELPPLAKSAESLEPGRALVRRRASDPSASAVVFAFGPLVAAALEAAEQIDATVVDMRFVKPLDEKLVVELGSRHRLCLTLEDNVLMGGAGSAVLEVLKAAGVETPLLRLGIPDRHLDPASREQMLSACGLDTAGVLKALAEALPAAGSQARRKVSGGGKA